MTVDRVGRSDERAPPCFTADAVAVAVTPREFVVHGESRRDARRQGLLDVVAANVGHVAAAPVASAA